MILSGIQQDIESKFQSSDGFLPYIEEIRFPMYKSLADEMTLRLDWPIVALVGPNGTNKSSVLHAISAAPEGQSLAQFWFSTEVDDIARGVRGKATHRFIYKYRFDSSGTSAECRKYRGSKKYRTADVPSSLRGKRDPDYWEPTKRVAIDAMAELPESGFDDWLSQSRDRWNPIQKNVIYLDFRSELSAFDKYIHHQAYGRWTLDATQKRYKVVVRSKWIARALAGKALPKAQAPYLIKTRRNLNQSGVAAIAIILGKPIVKIAMIEHRFFGPASYTVRLELADSGATYSEAHAGSGEYAVVRLVDTIRRAPAKSLILLDEPEVSLHPGAQTKLLDFIQREVLAHGHQVVLSTHSPSLAAGLPPKAIKVLGFDISEQRVVLVADGCSPTEAFTHLGHTTSGPTRPRLIVEDTLAMELVKASLRRLAPTKLDSLESVAFPGGADGIVKNVLPTFALTGVQKAGILLDGDQLPGTSTPTRDVLADADIAWSKKDLPALRSLWAEQFHKTQPQLHSNSDGSHNAETLHSYIMWANLHLGYLPGASPEGAIATAVDTSLPPNTDWKSHWLDQTRSELRLTPSESLTAEYVINIQRNALAKLEDGCSLLREVYETVARIIDW